MQLPIQPAIGLTFAHALRAFLRQDPDVVMVGEIRDAETAQVAMQAALTGHLVLSTLHTNDAVSTVTRLRDMGVEPYLLASTLTGVLAQRLVRRLCRQCREAYAPSAAEQRDAGIAEAELRGRPFFRPRGCPHCGHTGYQGRTGVFEWLRCTEPLRALVVQDAPAWQLRDHAVAHGLRTLREHAREKLLAGETSLAEVLRHT
jgi:type IV pilus assembly protein PilB